MIDFNILKGESLIKHTKQIIAKDNSEKISYFIEDNIGTIYLDTFYETSKDSFQTIRNDITLISVGHSSEDIAFINYIFTELDNLIDLDFEEQFDNNGSEIDIYSLSYSSTFSSNIIGQVISKKNGSGLWWDILWKDSDGKSNTNILNKFTLIHELGHALGLSHPFNNPSNKEYNSSDSIMSYNKAESGWDTWYSTNDLNALIKIWGREDDDGTIRYEEKFSNYKFKKENNNISIRTEIGYENINNIDQLIFKDQTKNLKDDIIGVFDMINDKDDITAKIYRLYNACFRRFPDKTGLEYWINKNQSGNDSYRSTAQSFIYSIEFQEQYGDNLTNKTYVNKLYEHILNRSPDEKGFNYWLNQINSGFEDKSELLMGFSESFENKSIFSNELGF